MKKGFKKQLEIELTEAINKTLEKHNTHALAKSKKIIRQSSKEIARKFNRSLKVLAKKKSILAEDKVKLAAIESRKRRPVAYKKGKSASRIKTVHGVNGQARNKSITADKKKSVL